MDIKVLIYSSKMSSTDWPEEGAADFISWFQNKIDSIPPEYRDSASIELDAVEIYGMSTSIIEIFYFRPETETEKKAKESQIAKRNKEFKKQELKQLEELEKKYRYGA